MAKHVLRDATVTINSVVLTTYVSKVTITSSRPIVDVTAMGALYVENILGIPDATIEMDMFQDYGAGVVDATLFPLSSTNTGFPVLVRVTSAGKSATNPEFQMTCLLPEYNPMDGSVGDANATSITLINASSTGLVRAVA